MKKCAACSARGIVWNMDCLLKRDGSALVVIGCTALQPQCVFLAVNLLRQVHQQIHAPDVLLALYVEHQIVVD
jgi:hypothetical protein